MINRLYLCVKKSGRRYLCVHNEPTKSVPNCPSFKLVQSTRVHCVSEIAYGLQTDSQKLVQIVLKILKHFVLKI